MAKRSILILFVLIQYPLHSLSQELGFVMVKNLLNATNPATSQTLIVKISNDRDTVVQIKSIVTIPHPFKLLLCPKVTEIEAHSSKNLLLTFSIPKNTKAGSYAINLTLRDLFDNVVFTFQKGISVNKVTTITAKLLKSLPYVRAGERATITYLIMNEGNASEQLSLQSRYASIEGKSNVQLPADSSLLVNVFAQTLKDILMPIDVSLDLKIMSEDGKLLKSIQKSVIVYPTKTAKNDPYVRLPLMISASYLGRKFGNAPFLGYYQYQLTADGGIDSGGKHRIDFMYRGPDQANVARIGTFAQKYIGYYNPGMSVYIGERAYSTSMLTDMFRFGLGSEIKYKTKKLQMKTYFVKPRFMPDLKNVLSFNAEYIISKSGTTNLSLVRKLMTNGKVIGLLGSSYAFNNNKNLKTDFGVATSLDQHYKSPAVQGNIEWGMGNFRAAGNALYASRKFNGYFSNTLFLSFNTGYQYKKWRVMAGVGYNDANPVQDTVYGVAPYSKSLSGGLGYKPTKNSTIVAQMIKRTKSDRFETKKFDYEEDFIKINATQNWKKASLSLSTEFGNTRNFLIKDGSNQSRNSDAFVNYSYRPSDAFSFNVFSHYLQTTRYSTSQQKILLYGTNLSFNIKSKLFFNLLYQNNFLVEELYSDRNLFDAKLSYKINPKTELSIYSNYAILLGTGRQKDFYSLVTLNREIGIPVARIMTFGTLEGQIINKGVEKIEGIIIYLDGNSAIANADGKFVFNNIRSGKHQLLIDRGSLAINDLPEQAMPMEVEIFPATVRKIEIGVLKAARIEGTVGIAKGSKVVRASGNELRLPQVVIEISNDRQTILTTSAADGSFSYLGLTPGNWMVRIIPTSWKADFTMQTESYSIILESGKAGIVSFELSPKIKQIKFKEAKTLEIGK